MKFTLRMNSWLQRCCFVAATLLMSTFALGQCNDTTACNYSQTDTTNVGCTYPGCIDFSACNYDAAAGCSDTSCEYTPTFSLTLILNEFDSIVTYQGFSYNVAGIYDVTVADADTNTSSCYDTLVTLTIQDVDTLGCTDISACNYNELAGTSDSSCTYFGCKDSTACNYDSTAGCNDAELCLSFDACGDCGGNGVLGCMDETACNFDSSATCAMNDMCNFSVITELFDTLGTDQILVGSDTLDSAGVYEELYAGVAANGCDSLMNVLIVDPVTIGCNDEDACNYDPTVGTGNDSLCVYPGCMDSTACNYDSTAGCNEAELCLSFDACGDCGGNGVLGCMDETACNFDSTATCAMNDMCNFSVITELFDTLGADLIIVGSDTLDSAAVYEELYLGVAANGCDSLINVLIVDPVTIGCNDEDACNYDPTVGTGNDTLCVYPGCMDSTACNFDPTAGCNEAELCLSFDACGDCGGNGVLGCMIEFACNYDSNATCPNNELCSFPQFGSVNESISSNDSTEVVIAGVIYNAGGQYIDTLIAANGCDSILTIFIVDTSAVGCLNPQSCQYDPFVGISNDSLCLTFYGCMDTTACNYDSTAGCDNQELCLSVDACGECGGNGVLGCMDINACNYDSAATCDNGSCATATSSSVDIIADSLSLGAGFVFMDTVYFEVGSYVYIATNDQGCDSIITVNIYDSTLTGCTVMSACNYNMYAGINDSSLCSFPGCMDSIACNYDANAICDNNVVCTYYGCTDATACNFNPTAACDDGSCVLPNGCTDVNACNYDPAATCDDGSCVLPNGCTDSTACNFDPAATCDDNSCFYETVISDTIEADSLALDTGVIVGNQIVFDPGTYTDTISVANGCDTIIEFLVVLGNNELSSVSNISLYPNPSSSLFKLSLGNLESNRIEIYDISSRRVYDVTQDHRGTVTFDVNNYAPGYYFMRIHLNNKVILQRFEVVR